MSTIQQVSIKDTRDQLANLIDQVAIAKKQFIITKFGKPKARIVPIIEENSQVSKRKQADTWKRFMKLAGIGKRGPADVSQRSGEYFAQIVEKKLLRRRHV